MFRFSQFFVFLQIPPGRCLPSSWPGNRNDWLKKKSFPHILTHAQGYVYLHTKCQIWAWKCANIQTINRHLITFGSSRARTRWFPSDPYFWWRNAVSFDIWRCLLWLCKRWNREMVTLCWKQLLLYYLNPCNHRRLTHLPRQSGWWQLCWTAHRPYCYTLRPSLRMESGEGKSHLCIYTWWSLPKSPSSPSSLWFRWHGMQQYTQSPHHFGTLQIQAENIGKRRTIIQELLFDEVRTHYTFSHVKSCDWATMAFSSNVSPKL